MKGYILVLVALAALLFAVPCEAGGFGLGGCGLGGCNGNFNQSLSINHNFNGFNQGLGIGRGFNRFGLGGFGASQNLTIRHRSGGFFNRGGHRTTIRHGFRF